MKYIAIPFMLILAACSSQSFSSKVADQVLGKAADKDYSRNGAQCALIKDQCSAGRYEEWVQDNGQKACVCN